MQDVINIQITIPDTQRLDVALAETLPDYSRRQLRRFIEQGGCYIGRSRISKCGYQLHANKSYTIKLYPFDSTQLEKYINAIDWPARILFRDKHYTIIDKPTGIASAASRASAKHHLVRILLERELLPPSAETVHRLDTVTSGVIVLGHSPTAIHNFALLFQQQSIRKYYLASTSVPPRETAWRTEGFLSRQVRKSGKVELSLTEKDGFRYSCTDFQLLTAQQNRHLVLCKPQTGRLHQLRVHLAHCGQPIDGDFLYGGAKTASGKVLLHCARLDFDHPFTGSKMQITTPMPEHFINEGWQVKLETLKSWDAPV